MLRTDFPAAGIHVEDHRALHRRANQQIYASDFASIQAAVDAAVEHNIGVVWLPTGTTILGQSIDLSAGGQPLRIQGQNTVLNARNLQDHAIKCLATRRNLHLSDFRIIAPIANYNGIHFDPGPTGNTGPATLKRIIINGGGGYGFYLKNIYGDVWLNQLYALSCRRGIYLFRGNATATGVLAARECDELAMEVDNLHGFNAQCVYLEDNQAEALWIHGNCLASSISTIYAERNNVGGVADYVLRFGDDANTLRGFSVGGIKMAGMQTTPPQTAYIRAGNFAGLEIAGLVDVLVSADATAIVLDSGVENQGLSLRRWVTGLDIDLSNESADYPATIESSILTGEITRRAI